jgi:hypothetical protein
LRHKRGRRKKLEEAIWWVVDHPPGEEPPSELHRKLQAACNKDEAAFMRDVVKQVLAATKPDAAAEAEADDPLPRPPLGHGEHRRRRPDPGTVGANHVLFALGRLRQRAAVVTELAQVLEQRGAQAANFDFREYPLLLDLSQLDDQPRL